MVSKKKASSKTYTLRISKTALQHIDEITGYIAFINHQPVNAIKVGDAIFETFNKIAATPLAFRECEELSTKTKIYRRANCFSWTVIYKILPSEIIVLGIIHQSRRPAAFKTLRKVK